MKSILAIVFGISYFLSSVLFASLRAFNSNFYRDMSPGKLNHYELKIYNGDAKIRDRVLVFVRGILINFTTPHIFILAGIITFLVWLILIIF